MRKLLLLLVLLALFLLGCNNIETVEEAFEQQMQEVEGDYEIVEIKEKDKRAFVAYTAFSADENNAAHIAFFKKEDKEWKRNVTAVCDGEWGGSLTTQKSSSLWCGFVTEPMVENVFVEGEKAETVEMGDQHWIWYSLVSHNPPIRIKAGMTDGSEEWWKEM